MYTEYDLILWPWVGCIFRLPVRVFVLRLAHSLCNRVVLYDGCVCVGLKLLKVYIDHDLNGVAVVLSHRRLLSPYPPSGDIP